MPLITALALVQAVGFDVRPEVALALESPGRYGRIAIHLDPVQFAIANGTWKPPREGETVPKAGGGTATWTLLKAERPGTFPGAALAGGYAFVSVPSDQPRVAILEANRHSMVYVNGEPRGGDVYGYGYVRIPVLLQKGENELLFAGGRGGLDVRLVEAPPKPALSLPDATLPDLVSGIDQAHPGQVVVLNPTTADQIVRIDTEVRGRRTQGAPFRVPALGARKGGFIVQAEPHEPGEVEAKLDLMDVTGSSIDQVNTKLRVRTAGQSRKVTFASEIDGSIQYYALQPATDPQARAIALSLHGASVEAIGQADAYTPKDWINIVCPTNRRPYGFDWEDWGRKDALEVLALAQKSLGADPARTYLTGHSMGGHGTWHLGATFPDRWLAVAPCAGWVSFFSYAGGVRSANPDPVVEILQRSANASDTLSIADNLLATPIYVLHGDADDNVPVTEARTMRDIFKGRHRDYTHTEKAGGSHWWGNDSVDWPGIFDLFRAREPKPRSRFAFRTVSPSVAATAFGATVEQQIRPFAVSLVEGELVGAKWRIKTSNVRRLTLDADLARSVAVDGDSFANSQGKALSLLRAGDTWRQASVPSGEKRPERMGPFKEAFNRRFVLVYGTSGRPEEAAWSRWKARYDAEAWSYRANGSAEILSDADFEALPRADRARRNVIIYGNSAVNRAWKRLLARCEVRVEPGRVTLGRSEWEGSSGALIVFPSPDGPDAQVGAIGGTDLAGMRAVERLPVFLSGVGYPDVTLLRPLALQSGAEGVYLAGFFGPDWRVASGDFARR